MDDHDVSLLDRAFSITIAFLLPGLIVMVGAATVSDVVKGWFGAATTSASFVGLFFVLFAALAIGIILTAVRWCVYERLNIHGHCLAGPRVPFNEANRSQHAAAYEDLKHQHYYHYLAYANMSVAIPVAITVWLLGAKALPATALVATVIVLGILGTLILGAAGVDACGRYKRRRKELLGAVPSAA